MAKHLSVEEIQHRLKIGGPEGFMRRFVANDNGAVKRFIDASVVPLWTQQDDGDTSWIDGGDVVTDVPIGQGNQLTANLLTKLASISINNPDFHVVAREHDEQGQMIDSPEKAQIGRAYLKDEWKQKNWKRLGQRSLLKAAMVGLGVLAYFWDEKGCQFEHVQSWDLAFDPFTVDFQKLKYAGRRLRKTLRQAKELYPKGPFKDMIAEGNENADSERVDIWVYWDKDTEAHIYDDHLLNADDLDNRYGKVPLHILEGDIYPGRSPFPLGDCILAAGAQAELSDLNLFISNIAKHGGPINLADPTQMDPAAKEGLEKGNQQGYIFIKALDGQRPPIIRVPGERLEPAVLEAKSEARNELDSITGVNQYDRGVLTDKPKFATEVAVSANRSGVRGSQARTNYETYVSRMAEICVELTVEFGGVYETPDGQKVGTDEHQILHDALSGVVEIEVIEGSTTFKDPATEQQSSMQIFDLVTRNYGLLVQAHAMGAIDALPDLKKYLDRCNRAFGVNNTEQMWVQVQPQPQGQQGKPPIENINYKDAPEDVRRQMEQQAGLQPSQTGTPPEAPEQPDTLAHHVDLMKQARDHVHETRLELLKQAHEGQIKQLEMAAQAQQAKAQPKNGAK